MTDARVPWSWQPRSVPLIARAVVGLGTVAQQLGQRVLQMEESRQMALEGLVGENFLVLLGAEAVLPWMDGVFYLGTDPRAPHLFLPTQREPSLHPALVEQAVLTQFPEATPPMAFAPELPGLLPLGAARPLHLPRLLKWLEEAR